MKADEVDQIKLRYERRGSAFTESLYSMTLPSIYPCVQETERALIRWIRTCHIQPLYDKRVLEVGCGAGSNLLRLIQLGFKPANIVGNELMEDRASDAQNRLPCAVRVIAGDASEIDLPEASFDIVFQSTVFTSLLDNDFQQKLADRMWLLTKPGGGILWYDFMYNNPRNPDVRGVPVKRIRELFPHGEFHYWRLTLAPPISRFVTRIHPSLYGVFNAFPFLRTHALCWIAKPKI